MSRRSHSGLHGTVSRQRLAFYKSKGNGKGPYFWFAGARFLTRSKYLCENYPSNTSLVRSDSSGLSPESPCFVLASSRGDWKANDPGQGSEAYTHGLGLLSHSDGLALTRLQWPKRVISMRCVRRDVPSSATFCHKLSTQVTPEVTP